MLPKGLLPFSIFDGETIPRPMATPFGTHLICDISVDTSPPRPQSVGLLESEHPGALLTATCTRRATETHAELS